MKKNLLKIASLLLVLAMIFSFAACKSDKDNGDSTAPSESSADANNTVFDLSSGMPIKAIKTAKPTKTAK